MLRENAAVMMVVTTQPRARLGHQGADLERIAEAKARLSARVRGVGSV